MGDHLALAQLECYRDVLARRFDLLADPKRPRHSAQRTSEMRALCADLRKVGPPGGSTNTDDHHQRTPIVAHASAEHFSPV